MALRKKDVVYTPDFMAKEIVELFKPSGSILEPCAGDGAFLRHLPTAEWCEIEKGKDFFQWHKKVNWIIGNPPYSIFNIWLRHSFTLADDIVYLIPLNKIFNDFGMLKDIYSYGGIVSVYAIGRGEKVNFPMGYAVGAVHFRRNWSGGLQVVFRDTLPNNRLHSDAGESAPLQAESTPKVLSTSQSLSTPAPRR